MERKMDNQLNIGHVNMVSFVSHHNKKCMLYVRNLCDSSYTLLNVPQYLSKANFIHVWLFQWGGVHVARAGQYENLNIYCLKFIQKSK